MCHLKTHRLAQCLVIWIALLSLSILPSIIYAQPFQQPDGVRETVWSPTGDQVALGYQDSRIEIVNLATGDVKVLLGHTAPVITLAWNPTGSILASGALHPDSTLRLWDTVSGEQIALHGDFAFDILDVTWSPDGSKVFATSPEGRTSSGNAISVDVNTDQVMLLRLGTLGVFWSLDTTRLAAVGFAQIRILDAMTMESLATYDIDRAVFRARFVNQPATFAWYPDGTGFAVGMGDGRVLLWQTDASEPTYTLVANDYFGDDPYLAAVNTLRFEDGGTQLTAVSGDGTLRTWEVASGALVFEQMLSPNYGADFSPYGARLALGLASPTEGQPPTTEVLSATLNNTDLAIITLQPSTEQLQTIATACNAPTAITNTIQNQMTDAAINVLESAISALADNAIPPACEADLLAVAEALTAP